MLDLSLKSKIYGLSDFDLKECNKKLENQRDFLSRSYYTSMLGELKSYLDISMSANFSPKYYAELVNRSNAISSFSFDYDLMPVFITITLNGCFREALRADFSKFKPKDKKCFDYNLKRNFELNTAFNINDLIFLLNRQWHLFVNTL